MNNISYVVYESTMARLERSIKRLWILCIILVLLLLTTNLAWLIYDKQYEYSISETTIEQEGTSNTIETFIGGDYNGEAKNNNNN